jgi:hypothetical protein
MELLRLARPIGGLLAAIAIASGAPPAAAQEAINMPAATQPSPGQWVVRELPRYWRYREGGEAASPRGLFELDTSVAYGIVSRLSLQADLPFYWQQPQGPGQRDRVGVGDLSLSLKLRLLQEDLGPVDTLRVAAFAGTLLPTGTDGFGSESFDPFLGVAATGIFGRHGLNASLAWRFTTGGTFDPVFAGETTADLLEFDASYLFRLRPAAYTEVHEAALYAVLELNGDYETSGDLEILLSPGLLYEAQRFALEASLQIPVLQRLEARPELAWSLVFGVRLLF